MIARVPLSLNFDARARPGISHLLEDRETGEIYLSRAAMGRYDVRGRYDTQC